MPPPLASDWFSIGTSVLATTRDDKGTILAQTGDVVAPQVDSSNVEWWQHVGFCSRPPTPNAGKDAAQVVTINTGGPDVAIASRDLRSGTVYGKLSDGETAIYAAGADGSGVATVMLKGDGAISLLTSDDGKATGSGIYLRVSKDGLKFMAPFGTLVFDKTGFHVVTQTGGRLDIGGLNAPGPLATVLPSYAKLTAGMVTVDAPTIMLGPSTGGVYQPAVFTAFPIPAKSTPIPLPAIPVPSAGLVSAAPGQPVTGAAVTTPTPAPNLMGSTRVFVGV